MKRYTLILALSFFVLILIAMSASATVQKTGSQGDYFPLTFHFADGDVPALIDVASINVLFDPPGLSNNPKEETAKATPWKHHDIQGLDAPTLEFTSGEPYRLEMDMFFDRYEEGKSVREWTDKIEKLALVHQELHRPPTTLAAPLCLITWENKTYACEVETTETKFTLFQNAETARAVGDEGIPVRAVMHIVFSEFSLTDKGKNDGPHIRPGPAKSKEISGTESEIEIIQAHFDILRDAVKTSIDDSNEKERNTKGGGSQGIEQSMLSKVDNAEASFERENIKASINQLEALINEVEAQRGKAITEKNADLLKKLTEQAISLLTQFPLQLACIQPPSGIIGWWSGDNALGLINGNNAVLHDDASFASGKVGNAFNFDGIGDYASIPYSPDLEPSEITVEFWVSGPQISQQPGNTGSGVMLIENSPIHANYDGWYIFITPSGGIGTAIGNGVQWNPVISNFGLYYPTGWRHVAMTYDGTYLQLYLDGVPQLGPLGNQVSNAQLSTGRDINIGASWNNGNFARFFKGLIDEVEIYDRALSVSEIQSIYNAGGAGKCKPDVCVAAPSELVGWWAMDDAAGSSVAVDRAGGNNGIVNGATLGVTGNVATAADFDGVDDYIEVPDNPALNIADAITIDAWVKVDSLPGGRLEIAEKASFGAGNGYSFSIFPTGEVWFYPVNSQIAWASNTQLSLNTWHHIAVTFEANNAMKLYIDGQIDKSVYAPSWFPPMEPSTEPLRIGRFFDGKIDELEIFNRALSPFEIWAIHNAGTAGKCKPLTPADPVE